jgi:hypothetical protein
VDHMDFMPFQLEAVAIKHIGNGEFTRQLHGRRRSSPLGRRV